MGKLSLSEKKKADFVFRDMFDALAKPGISRKKFLGIIRRVYHIHFGETHLSPERDRTTAYELLEDAHFIPQYAYLENMVNVDHLARKLEKLQQKNKFAPNVQIEPPHSPYANKIARHNSMVRELSKKINLYEKVVTYGGSAHTISGRGKQVHLNFKTAFEDLTGRGKKKVVVMLLMDDQYKGGPTIFCLQALGILKTHWKTRPPDTSFGEYPTELLEYLSKKLSGIENKIRMDERAILQPEGYYLYVNSLWPQRVEKEILRELRMVFRAKKD